MHADCLTTQWLFDLKDRTVRTLTAGKSRSCAPSTESGCSDDQYCRYSPFQEKAKLKKTTKQPRATRVQNGALPYRLNDDGCVEVLLVTSRETKRWIIPKGWPIKGLTPAKAAAREAFEEAGVQGRVAARSLGLYTYEKRLEDLNAYVPCEVRVFPLAVKRQLDNWPESKERVARWFPAAEAARLVNDKNLSDLILQFDARKGRRK